MILATLRAARGPLAAEEIVHRTGLSWVQVARRWAELVAAGLVERDETSPRYLNASGRGAYRHRLCRGGRS